MTSKCRSNAFELLDRLYHILALKNSRTDDETIGASVFQEWRCFQIDAAVDLKSEAGVFFFNFFYLCNDFFIKSLSLETNIVYSHKLDVLDLVFVCFENIQRVSIFNASPISTFP